MFFSCISLIYCTIFGCLLFNQIEITVLYLQVAKIHIYVYKRKLEPASMFQVFVIVEQRNNLRSNQVSIPYSKILQSQGTFLIIIITPPIPIPSFQPPFQSSSSSSYPLPVLLRGVQQYIIGLEYYANRLLIVRQYAQPSVMLD